MKCEVEFLAVGEGSRAGDAIVIRYGEEDNYQIMVVDGGTAETGENMVKHLRDQFGLHVSVKHMVLTHSDADHASGLREVIKNITVSNLWLHVPWEHAEESAHLFEDKGMSVTALAAKIKDSCDIVAEIVDLAVNAGTAIHYAFAGERIGPFTVLSPTREAYIHLMPQFSRTPEPDRNALVAVNMWIGKGQPQSLLAKLFEKARSWVAESWVTERLKDGGQTSASNESSVVMYADTGLNKYLLTGDAGINALTWAASNATAWRLPLQQFSFVQIPHHGSRRNVGPTILNALLGGPIPEGTNEKFFAFVSCPAKDDTHPRKIVLNAFMRRGGRVLATEGQNKVFFGGFAARPNYAAVVPMPFSAQVEEYT